MGEFLHIISVFCAWGFLEVYLFQHFSLEEIICFHSRLSVHLLPKLFVCVYVLLLFGNLELCEVVFVWQYCMKLEFLVLSNTLFKVHSLAANWSVFSLCKFQAGLSHKIECFFVSNIWNLNVFFLLFAHKKCIVSLLKGFLSICLVVLRPFVCGKFTEGFPEHMSSGPASLCMW